MLKSMIRFPLTPKCLFAPMALSERVLFCECDLPRRYDRGMFDVIMTEEPADIDLNESHLHALEALQQVLPERVFCDEVNRMRASLDNLRLSVMPDVVIKVQAAQEVAQVLQLAHQYGVPVTVRGAGSSATGSAVPIRHGWVLDMAALNGWEVDPVSRIARVEAGVVTADLQTHVEAMGLFYPPDPSSKKYSTIGGNVACNAGGMRCVKYGVTRDYVLGLHGFLADGSPFDFGLPLKKYVSGLNVRDLLIGSEGLLAVVTEIDLKLLPLPEKRWTALYAFASEQEALGAVTALFRAGVQPSILEFLDRQTVQCAEQYTQQTIFEAHPGASLLMIELDGSAYELNAASQQVESCWQKLALGQRTAETQSEAEAIWQVRRTCSQSMFSLADTKLNEDVVVPIERQVELIEYTLTLKRQIGLATPTFGHAGDGNLHVHIMYDRADADQCRRAQQGIQQLMQKVVDLGGVITGEHGIGLAKAPFMSMQHRSQELAVMQALKASMDPKGILNPGKMFEPFEVWDHTPVKVELPWDHR